MTACEQCWTEAARKAAILGGFTADRYQEELAAHPEHGPEKRPTADEVAATLSIALMPWQRDIADRIIAGENVVIMRGRKAGWSTVQRVVAAAAEVTA